MLYAEEQSTARAPQVIKTITVTCLALACISVALRIWSKLSTGRRVLMLDDAFMISSLFFYVWFTVLALILTSIETNNPVLTKVVADHFLLRLSIGECIFMISTVFLKLSLLVYYRQFVWKKWQRHAIWAAGICSISLSFCGALVGILQCGDLSDLASKHIHNKCINKSLFFVFLYTHGITSALTDWAFAFLPIFVLVRSNLRGSVKFGACLLLGLGVAGSVAACVRTYYVPGIWFDAESLDPNHRPTYYSISAAEINLAILEIGFGITAASLACLQPLLRKLGQTTKSWFSGSKCLVSWGCSSGSSVVERQQRVDLSQLVRVVEINMEQERISQNAQLPANAIRKQRTADAPGPQKADLGVIPTVDSLTGITRLSEVAGPAEPVVSYLGTSKCGVLPTFVDTIDEPEMEGSSSERHGEVEELAPYPDPEEVLRNVQQERRREEKRRQRYLVEEERRENDLRTVSRRLGFLPTIATITVDETKSELEDGKE